MSITEKNYLNLHIDDIDRRVYRIISFERLVEMIETKQNALVLPELWDDPFENIILKTSYEGVYEGEIGSLTFDFHKNIHGQCWTFERDSDALWRIYSRDGSGVRISSTIRTLLESLDKVTSLSSSVISFIGKVHYQSEEIIKNHLLNKSSLLDFAADHEGHKKASTLIQKREHFSHEAEIRLLRVDNRPEQNITGKDHQIYRYDFDFHAAIQEVCFDPRISKRMYDLYSTLLAKNLEYTGRISKSNLYEVGL